MDLNLKNKVFFVIGGVSGIGAGISWVLVVEGVLFVIVGCNKVKGDVILEELGMGF